MSFCPMKTPAPFIVSARLELVVVVLAAFGAATSTLTGQSLPAAQPDAATVARYDANRNGRLDRDELDALEADQRKLSAMPATNATIDRSARDETVLLSPFEVVGDTKGY